MMIARCRILILLTVPAVTGCRDDENRRLAEFAQQSAQRQAEQNQELSRLNREVASGTKLLVEADSQARQELTSLQRDLQSQQAELAHRHDRLEAERAELAQERRREALLAAVLSRLGEIVLCALPLVLAGSARGFPGSMPVAGTAAINMFGAGTESQTI